MALGNLLSCVQKIDDKLDTVHQRPFKEKHGRTLPAMPQRNIVLHAVGRLCRLRFDLSLHFFPLDMGYGDFHPPCHPNRCGDCRPLLRHLAPI
jgi:hypothetical protein